jgi:hypothetical protein
MGFSVLDGRVVHREGGVAITGERSARGHGGVVPPGDDGAAKHEYVGAREKTRRVLTLKTLDILGKTARLS